MIVEDAARRYRDLLARQGATTRMWVVDFVSAHQAAALPEDAAVPSGEDRSLRDRVAWAASSRTRSRR